MARELEEAPIDEATKKLDKILSSIKTNYEQIHIADITEHMNNMKEECSKIAQEINKMSTNIKLLKCYKHQLTGQTVVKNDKGELVSVPPSSAP